MLIRCIDFETTGVPTEEDPHAIVEVGICDIHEDRPAPEQHSILCNPGRTIPIEAMSVHHITDADVADAVSPTDGVRLLMEGAPDLFVAHNADFERKFFAGGDVPWICTWKVALRLWPDAPSHSLQVLRYYLDLPVDHDRAMPPHRAAPDAYLCAVLMVRIMEVARHRIDEMVKWSNGPALLPRITFGKHRGKRWEDAPIDYLEWIADKSDMDRDVKANARHWIKVRRAA